MVITNGRAVAPVEGSKALSVLLALIGAIALSTSMWMNARFGWGLSADLGDRTILAVLHALLDPAAAGMIAAAGLMFRWSRRKQGVGVLAFAVLLIAYSILSVFGFMSARIATTQSHDAIVEMQKSQWAWTLKSSINRELPKQERLLLHNEAQEQSRMIQASISIIPDAQAAGIAAALGVPVDKVQRSLVMTSSCIAQTIKFVCLLAAVMIWPRGKDYEMQASSNSDVARGPCDAGGAPMQAASLASLAASPASMQAPSPPTPNASPASTPASRVMQGTTPAASLRKMPREKLYEYLRQHASGTLPPLSQRQMALETGWHQSSVSRKLRRIMKRTTRQVPKGDGTDAASRLM